MGTVIKAGATVGHLKVNRNNGLRSSKEFLVKSDKNFTDFVRQ